MSTVKTWLFFVALLLVAIVAFLMGAMVGAGHSLGYLSPLGIGLCMIPGPLLVFYGMRVAVRRLDGTVLRRALFAALIALGGFVALWSLVVLLLMREVDRYGEQAVEVNLFGVLAAAAIWFLFLQARRQVRDGMKGKKAILEAFE